MRIVPCSGLETCGAGALDGRAGGAWRILVTVVAGSLMFASMSAMTVAKASLSSGFASSLGKLARADSRASSQWAWPVARSGWSHFASAQILMRCSIWVVLAQGASGDFGANVTV